MPWIYDLKEPTPNPRDRKPKVSKASLEKVERIKRIQKNLEDNDKKILEYRQNKMDNRALGGIDKIISKTLPSFIKGDTEDIPEFMRRKSKERD